MTITADAADLLAPTAPKVRRDHYGRYLVLPPDGRKPIGYTRMTTVAKALDDQSSLVDWARRMGALGTAMRPDLVKLLKATDPDDRKALNDLAEKAAETAGSVGRRELGTMVHSMFERSLEAGYVVPAAHAADIAAIHAAIAAAGYEIVQGMSERIVVLDAHRIAGMPDCFLRNVATGTLHVGDLKTGSVKYGTLGWAIQLAGYSMADALYTQGAADDGSDDTREPLPPVDGDLAVIIHAEPSAGSCDLYALDIAKGREALALALDVRTMRKAKVLTKITGTAPAATEQGNTAPNPSGEAPSGDAVGRAGSTDNEGESDAPTDGKVGVDRAGDQRGDLRSLPAPDLPLGSGDVVSQRPAGPDGDALLPRNNEGRRSESVSSPARHAWALGRATAIVEFSDAARNRLTRLWQDAGVPTFKACRDAGTTHTDEQLAVVLTLLDAVEGEFEIPFGPPDPDAPVPEVAAPVEPIAPEFDEGEPTSAEHSNEIKAALLASDKAAQTAVTRWVVEGRDGGRPFHMRGAFGKLRQRRARLMAAAIHLARWDCDDDAARTAIGIVIGEAVQPAVTVGVALGSLTIEEADRLMATIAALDAGRSLTFSDDGTPHLAA